MSMVEMVRSASNGILDVVLLNPAIINMAVPSAARNTK